MRGRDAFSTSAALAASLLALAATVLGGCALGGCGASSDGAAPGGHPPPDYRAQAIPHTKIDRFVQRFDAAAGAGGTLHLVWQGESTPLYYQESRDGGASWAEPVALDLANAPRFVRGNIYSGQMGGPWLVGGESAATGEEDLRVLWVENGLRLRVRSADGDGWQDPGDPVAEQPDGSFGQRYDLLRAGGKRLYLAFSSHDGFFVTRSADRGRSWGEPVKVAPYHDSPLNLKSTRVSLVKREDNLHLLWLQWEERASELGYRMYLSASRDAGRTWSAPAEIRPDLSAFADYYDGQRFIYTLDMLPAEEGLRIFFSERGEIFDLLVGPGGRMQRPARRVVGQHSGQGVAAAQPLSDSAARLVWYDIRYRATDWWAKVPLLPLLAFDKSPLWVNGDLMVRRLRPAAEGGAAAGAPEVVTPALSGIEGAAFGDRPRLVASEEGRVYLFWSGRRKVGKTREAFGYPNRLFFARLR